MATPPSPLPQSSSSSSSGGQDGMIRQSISDTILGAFIPQTIGTLFSYNLKDFLDRHSYLKYIVNKINLQQEELDTTYLDIEKYAVPHSFLSKSGILAGLVVDAVKIATSYYASAHWLGILLIGLSVGDGCLSTATQHLNSRIHKEMMWFTDNEMVDDFANISKPLLVQASNDLKEIFREIQEQINSDIDVYKMNYPQGNMFWDLLSDIHASFQRIDSLANSWSTTRTITRTLATLSGIANGIVGAIYGTDTTPTAISATISVALSSLSDRIAAMDESLTMARLVLLIPNTYCQIWNVMDKLLERNEVEA
jgi:hypothetical protein